MVLSKSIRRISVVLLLFCIVSLTPAAVNVAEVFRDNMVLQRDKQVAVWGEAPDGYTAAVEFDSQTKTTVAVSGKWRVRLDPMAANAAGQNLTVEFYNGAALVETITYSNVLVGDVYLAGGQSNMELSYGFFYPGESTVNNNLIRFYPHPRRDEWGDQTPGPAQWTVCANNTATKNISGTAYCFATELQPHAGVPIGVITSSVGASPVEAWMSEAALLSDPDFIPILDRIDDNTLPGRKVPTLLYEQMIAPMLPFTLNGFIWYQGEANANSDPLTGAIAYRDLFPALINQWRNDFEAADAHFFFVQLAGFGGYDPNSDVFGNQTTWALLREAQYLTLSVTNTGMACGLDLGERFDIHPATKKEVGDRLSLLARDNIYGESIVSSGPIFIDHEVVGDKVVLDFNSIGSGLTIGSGTSLVGFEIAAMDRLYVDGTASIVGNTVEVTGVSNPAYVRYGWKNWPEFSGQMVNLYNNEGLPATSFRTEYTLNKPIPDISIYKASGGFSGVQGGNNWYYQESNGSTYTDMSWDAANNRWQGSTTYLRIFSNACHPGPGIDAVRVWEAPESGVVNNITGVVSKTGLTSGNGVVALIYKNATLLWSDTVAPDTEVAPTGVGNIAVSAGDRIYFHINDNGNGNSDYTRWDPEIEFSADTQPPAVPTNLVAVAQAGSIDLSWDANGEGDLDHYNVKRSNISSSGYAVIDSTSAGTTTYTDLTALPGEIYYYVVTAVDASSNESGISNEDSAPLYPGDLTLDNQIDLQDVAELGFGWQTPYDIATLLDIANNWLAGID